MKKYTWPPQHQIDEFLKEIADNEESGSLHLNDDATPIERFRFDLCQQLLAYMQIHKIKQKDLAKMLGSDEPEMSRILHHRIDKVSTDKLLRMVQQLNPKVKLSIVGL
ncbi:MAG: XRE family transcriptional regulator [Bdellovibrionota bacterium]